jgi:hypothetical protein
MSDVETGIHRVSTEHLKRVLRALHRGVLPSPVTRSALIEKAFGDFERDLDVLVGLDARGAQAVIASVLKQRNAGSEARAQLVYMGPPSAGTKSRDALEVVREQLATATRSITLLGAHASGMSGALLSTLAAAVQGRGLRAHIAFDADLTSAAAEAERVAEADVRSRLAPLGVAFYAFTERRARGHALLVDSLRLYVSSAPLDATEDEGYVDFGAIIEDLDAVRAFEEEWARLLRSGQLTPR